MDECKVLHLIRMAEHTLHLPLQPALQHLQNDPAGMAAFPVSLRSLPYALRLNPGGIQRSVPSLWYMPSYLQIRSVRTAEHLRTR